MNNKDYNAKYRELNREKLREDSRQRRRKFKQQILERYGRSCAWCGFTDIRALQLDHINDNGAEDRKNLVGGNYGGAEFYRKLIKAGLPDGYQILCANCNQIKQLGENF